MNAIETLSLDFNSEHAKRFKESVNNFNASSYPSDLNSFLSLKSWDVYIERVKKTKNFENVVNIIFATDALERLQLNNNTLLLTVAIDLRLPPKLLGFRWVPNKVGTKSNRNMAIILNFEPFKGHLNFNTVSLDCYKAIQQLPVSLERSKQVQERIETWDVYLKFLANDAEKQEAIIDYHSYRVAENHRKITFKCTDIVNKMNNKRLKNGLVSIIDLDFDEDRTAIGALDKYSNDEIIIELNDYHYNAAIRNKLKLDKKGKLIINNIGELAQTNRLYQGMQKLKHGKALNPKIEDILFGDVSNVDNTKPITPITHCLHNNLNEYQIRAVEGALSAEDIFIVQGPPGTGKTTFIAELCYQNAIRGLKTLVASQSNLAVDNALSKLENHKSMRILRKGNADSVESEGKPFLEENIVEEWIKQTREATESNLITLTNVIAQYNENILKTEQNYILAAEQLGSYELKITDQQHMLTTSKKSLHKLENDKAEQLLYLRDTSEHLNKLHNVIKSTGAIIAKERLQIDTLDKNNRDDLEHANTLSDKVMDLTYRLEPITINMDKVTPYYEWKTEAENLTERIADNRFKIDNCNQLKTEMQNKLTESRRTSSNYFDEPHNVTKLKNMFIQLASYPQLSSENLNGLNQLKQHVQHCEMLQRNMIGFQESYKKLYHEYERAIMVFKSENNTVPQLLVNVNTMERNWDINLIREVSTVINSKPSMLNTVISFFKGKNEKKEEWLNNLATVIAKVASGLSLLQDEVNKTSNLLVNTISKQNVLEQIKELNYKISNEIINSVNKYRKQIDNFNDSLVLHERSKAELTTKMDSVSKLIPELKDKTKLQFLDYYKSLQQLWVNTKLLLKNKEDENAIQISQRNIEIAEAQNKIEKLKLSLEPNNVEIGKHTEKQASTQQILNQIADKINILSTQMTDIANQLKILEHDETRTNNDLKQCASTVTKLKQEIMVANKKMKLAQKWLEQLENISESNKDVIKKIYIQTANVIGITCIQSASKNFSEQYPNFDTVIIDEVSKATPPELLLPMLKGKKTVLVGDHRQLPPMIGNDTLMEYLENSNLDDNEKAEQLEYFKESLFQRLYDSLPDRNKQILKIQYRMHPHIMNTINQFYQSNLICGLTNPDLQRQHNIQGKIIKPNSHAMWLDVPLHPYYAEQRDAQTKSYYNETELKIIYSLLEEMNESYKEQQVIKEVGLISFYGAQVKMMNEWHNQFSQLNLRIGTVDRFQGIEKDIIIASFVRNNANRKMGFAQDERRVNVALSRARELLVIVGCSELFSVKPPYKKVIDEISSQNGYLDLQGQAISS